MENTTDTHTAAVHGEQQRKGKTMKAFANMDLRAPFSFLIGAVCVSAGSKYASNSTLIAAFFLVMAFYYFVLACQALRDAGKLRDGE